jgi:1-deoxy-D-xylulose-5-phosphate reductoisomerase
MVEFCDGATMAQASPPDMRLPIALALGWPDRIAGIATPCVWSTAATWEFFPLDEEAFPAVSIGRAAAAAGGTAPAVFNAANEECVAAFLAGRLPFLAIVDTVEEVLAEHEPGVVRRVEDVYEAEWWARTRARELSGNKLREISR